MKQFFHLMAIIIVLNIFSPAALAQNTGANEGTESFQIVAVDLGLPSGLKWATCNIGANSPEEYGDYFAWGETMSKDNYDHSTYKWYKEEDYSYTKYCTKSRYGEVDDKREFRDYNYEDDAARVHLGGNWRVPTKKEWDELIEKCTWTWTEQNGISGYKVTGPNGKNIFLPAAGYRYGTYLNDRGHRGYYWSSSTDGSSEAGHLYFKLDDVYTVDSGRLSGESIRPVTE